MVKETDEYRVQALDFLKKTKTKFEVKFLKHDKYFHKDEESRDIYEITLTRGERKYTFTFGQSIANSGLALYLTNGKRTPHQNLIIPDEKRKQITELAKSKQSKERSKARFKVDYWMRENVGFPLCELAWRFIEPTAYDVLATIEKYVPETFEEFCMEYGYDEDSLSAHKIFEDCRKQYLNIQALYNEDELEELRQIN